MKTLISFRLRKLLDADLIAAGVDEDQLPDLCRDGLRLMLGLNKTREIGVIEKPIVAAQTRVREERAKTPMSNSKPTAYIAPHLRKGGLI